MILDNYIAQPNTRANEARYSTAASTISDQFDLRVDHVLNSIAQPVRPLQLQGLGPYFADRAAGFRAAHGSPARPRNFVVSDNLVLRPNLINEGRFGFTLRRYPSRRPRYAGGTSSPPPD